MYANVWHIDNNKILLKHEIATVLEDLREKARCPSSARLNLTVFRLACCCGLRVSEIAGLQLGDFQLAGPRPHLRIRAQIAKGGRSRRVPLWWDAGTLTDLMAWHAERVRHGAKGQSPFVCGTQGAFADKALTRATVRRRFLTACKKLGLDRIRSLMIHHGRHTLTSHALAGG